MPSPDDTKQPIKTFEHHLMPVFESALGLAISLTHDRHDAEDLLQEAMVRAFCAFHKFQAGTNFRAWFFKLLTNLFLTRYRKKWSAPVLHSLEEASEHYLYSQIRKVDLPERCFDPLEIVLGRTEQERVLTAIATLPVSYRVVATLYFLDDFSYQEVSEIVPCPIGTVRSRLHRARKLLQQALWQMAHEQGRFSSRPSETV